MKKLYIMRHGETDANKNKVWSDHDNPLNETGQDQAKTAAAKMKAEGLNFDLIITSTQPRAIETSKFIAEAVNYPVDKIITDPSTDERFCGTLEGTKNTQASEEYKLAESSIDSYPSVESMPKLQTRANNFWGYLKTLNQDTVLLVGHGAFIRALLRNVNKNPITERGHVLRNCEVIILEIDPIPKIVLNFDNT